VWKIFKILTNIFLLNILLISARFKGGGGSQGTCQGTLFAQNLPSNDSKTHDLEPTICDFFLYFVSGTPFFVAPPLFEFLDPPLSTFVRVFFFEVARELYGQPSYIILLLPRKSENGRVRDCVNPYRVMSTFDFLQQKPCNLKGEFMVLSSEALLMNGSYCIKTAAGISMVCPELVVLWPFKRYRYLPTNIPFITPVSKRNYLIYYNHGYCNSSWASTYNLMKIINVQEFLCLHSFDHKSNFYSCFYRPWFSSLRSLNVLTWHFQHHATVYQIYLNNALCEHKSVFLSFDTIVLKIYGANFQIKITL
jgi:hypothetical protein